MFFDQSENHAPVLLEAGTGRSLTGAQLSEIAGSAHARLRSLTDGGLVFLLTSNDLDSAAAYVACLSGGVPVALIEQASFARFGTDLLRAYEPAVVLGAFDGAAHSFTESGILFHNLAVWSSEANRRCAHPVHPDVALLLTTSGSTGSPKCVRLSAANLEANAQSIRGYLGLTADERSMQSLPLHYSYGLSLLNSHLAAGALTVLTEASFMSKAFWETFAAQGCTSFAGVPFMYETLHRLRFDPQSQPTLQTMTQAGGNLRPEIKTHLAERLAGKGGRFFAMYGQTEATARMTYVPPDRLAEKATSIGIPIPGGMLEICPIEGVPAPAGELVYRGPNVMMGYAGGAADLARGDEMNGVLSTGDIGWRDDDGFFHVSGRLKRFAKCQGRRVNLDDVERRVESQFNVMASAVEHSKGLGIFFSGPAEAMVVRSAVADFLMIPPAVIHCEALAQLPVLPTGKKDYRALQV
jgi:acyl-CoA synthetase (AMP-forming)/AMP-acid ligase II